MPQHARDTVPAPTAIDDNEISPAPPATKWPRAPLLAAGPLRSAAGLVAVLSSLIAVLAPAGAAQASATGCAGDSLYSTCIDVKGTNLHVDTIKGQVTTPPINNCITGHSQILINGGHFADSPIDRTYCNGGKWTQQKHTTATWNVNRSYTKGTRICAKFWYKKNGVYTYKGLACITIG